MRGWVDGWERRIGGGARESKATGGASRARGYGWLDGGEDRLGERSECAWRERVIRWRVCLLESVSRECVDGE